MESHCGLYKVPWTVLRGISTALPTHILELAKQLCFKCGSCDHLNRDCKVKTTARAASPAVSPIYAHLVGTFSVLKINRLNHRRKGEKQANPTHRNSRNPATERLKKSSHTRGWKIWRTPSYAEVTKMKWCPDHPVKIVREDEETIDSYTRVSSVSTGGTQRRWPWRFLVRLPLPQCLTDDEEADPYNHMAVLKVTPGNLRLSQSRRNKTSTCLNPLLVSLLCINLFVYICSENDVNGGKTTK